MYLRFTPAFAVSVFLTSILALWITADVANGDFSPTVFSNTVTAAWAASLLYWASGLRRERSEQERHRAERAQVEQEAEQEIRRIR